MQHVLGDDDVFSSLIAANSRRQPILPYGIHKGLIHCTLTVVVGAFDVHNQSTITINGTVCYKSPPHELMVPICKKFIIGRLCH